MRNSYILYKNIRAMVKSIDGIEKALIEDYHNPILRKINEDTLELMPHRAKVYESKERNIYTLITRNHPTVECIVAKACYNLDLRDYFYTVTIDYRNGDELYISPNVRRKYNASTQDYTIVELGR